MNQMKWSGINFMGKFKKAVGAAGLAAGVAYLSKKENRQKLKKQLDHTISKFRKPSKVKGLGKPIDIADAKMVDEGAMTSVQYYNEWQEEKAK